MIDQDFLRRLSHEFRNLFPLFRYLILQTETHAFCLALAGAALLGFFPTCLVMLAIFKNILRWQGAYDVLLSTIYAYFPVSQDFVRSNLVARLQLLQHGGQLSSLLWVLLGAAGVFIPLETALNRLWKVHADRPYWLNQLVGGTLTIACTLLALLFLSFSTVLHRVAGVLPFSVVRTTAHFIIIRSTMTGFFIVAVFAFYKFLPNKKIDARQVLPAAILAGIMAELVRVVFVRVIPNLESTQGPFSISVTFLLLVYFQTFVVLGCAFLASQTERYPWLGFLPLKRTESPPS
jgi:membrane protein